MGNSSSCCPPPSLAIAGGWTAETLCFHVPTPHPSAEIGSVTTDLAPNTVTPLHLTLWYPTDASAVVEQQLALGHEDDPFWCYLWPTAQTLAQQVLMADCSSPQTVLETGCGIGLVGLAALAAGAEKVTFEDLRSPSVDLALHNAQCNGFGDRAQGRVRDWCQVSPSASPPGQFDWILASDVLYHQASHEPLLAYLVEAIAPNGSIWIGDPGRKEAVEFFKQAQRYFKVELFKADNTAMTTPLRGQYQRFVLRP
ncbi:MAG: methyltransferase domain-containing protein [Merismopedia sp. SIO2A8]|nr:methyltransferase domain-containing protein [Merismopedia sp. SIO2A8]